jgi:lysophospholipase L1-like esterase
MDEEQREMFWDDGLHFTEEGYKLIGELVGRRLVEVIEQANTEGNGGESAPVDEE